MEIINNCFSKEKYGQKLIEKVNFLTKILKKLINTQSINLDWNLYNKSHEIMLCNLDIVKLPNQTKNIVHMIQALSHTALSF